LIFLGKADARECLRGGSAVLQLVRSVDQCVNRL